MTDRTAMDSAFIAEMVSDAIKSRPDEPFLEPAIVDQAVVQLNSALLSAGPRGKSLEDLFKSSDGWQLNPIFKKARARTLPRAFGSVHAQFTQSIDQYAAAEFLQDVNERYLEAGPWKENYETADRIARVYGALFWQESKGRQPENDRKLLENHLRIAISHWAAPTISLVNIEQGFDGSFPKDLIPVLARKDFGALHDQLPPTLKNFLKLRGEDIKHTVNVEYFGSGTGQKVGDALVGKGLLRPDQPNHVAINNMLRNCGILDSGDGNVDVFSGPLEQLATGRRITLNDFANNALYGPYGQGGVPYISSADYFEIHTTFNARNSALGSQYYELRHHAGGVDTVHRAMRRSQEIESCAQTAYGRLQASRLASMATPSAARPSALSNAGEALRRAAQVRSASASHRGNPLPLAPRATEARGVQQPTHGLVRRG
ncbi:hypothetical protein F8271_26100 [Micromonospora sp. ALFpr18c]|uniref:hypothetical protein n=1 Tax=Micromonospora sp. ALFpr18c TaxID=1458665 RepID=UPI00124BA251|nr:hypothetical protein [Micromonospora sp. ALFpr18c]KAB1931881.1 hypothetical protein F8271_26100 [Micromonospora sp. ALFpr18c]